ncbi:hypothetical protein ACHAXS_007424 [Conticribra weissflogii]
MGNAVISGILFQPPSPPNSLSYFGPNRNNNNNSSHDEDAAKPFPQTSSTACAPSSPTSSIPSNHDNHINNRTNNGNYPSVNYIWIRTSTGTFIPAVHIVHPSNTASYFSNHNQHNSRKKQSATTASGSNNNPPPGKYTLLYSHGNAEDIGLIANFLTDLSRLLGVNIFCFDYSGYGVSTDKVYVSVMLREFGGELDRWRRWMKYRSSSGGDGAERSGLVGWIEEGSLDLQSLEDGMSNGLYDGESEGCDIIVDGSGCFTSSLMDKDHDDEFDTEDDVHVGGDAHIHGAKDENSHVKQEKVRRYHPKAAVGWGRDIFVAPMVHPVNYKTGAVASTGGRPDDDHSSNPEHEEPSAAAGADSAAARVRDEFDFDDEGIDEDATRADLGYSNGADAANIGCQANATEGSSCLFHESEVVGDDADGGYFFNTCGAMYQEEEQIPRQTMTSTPHSLTTGNDAGTRAEGQYHPQPRKILSPRIRRARLLDKHSWTPPTPSEAQCYIDIEAAYAYLTEIEKVHPKDILLYGKSVGSGPTCYLAQKLCDESELAKERQRIEEEEGKDRHKTENQSPQQRNILSNRGRYGGTGSKYSSSSDDENSSQGQEARDDESENHARHHWGNASSLKDVAPGGVVLHSPFLSVIRVVLDVGFTTIGDLFPNVDRVKDVSCPVYVIHGTDDEIVPFYHGESLFNLLPDSSKTVPFWARGASHNNIEMEMPTAYIKRLQQFVRQCHRIHNPPPPLPIHAGMAASMRMLVGSSTQRGPTTANEVLQDFRRQQIAGQRSCIKRYASQDTYHESCVKHLSNKFESCSVSPARGEGLDDTGANEFNKGHSTVKTKKSSKQRKQKGTLVMKSSHDHIARQSFSVKDDGFHQTPPSSSLTRQIGGNGHQDSRTDFTANFDNTIQGRRAQVSSYQRNSYGNTASIQYLRMNVDQEQMQMQKLYTQQMQHQYYLQQQQQQRQQQQQQQRQPNRQYLEQHTYNRSASSVASVSSRSSSQFSVQQMMQQHNPHRSLMAESNYFVRHHGVVSQSTHGH